MRVSSLLDELAQLPQENEVGAGKPRTEKVDLVDLVRRAWAETNAVGRRLVVVLPSIPQLIGNWNRQALDHLVANLLENALKYSLEEQDVLVSVGCDGEWAVLEVIDQGVAELAFRVSTIKR